ncbi:hypothetical protein [Bizionia myxarmorum]|uniref:DUF1772 domain-containing protein n=1 Tax=Bizionia myxarmorum TaxID=291186 RepID=A0A5D0RFN3_9FLAO|nr:hypothetical protein [Bizionia myxarmorum]TYB79776.1 hypothetical protein ES674_08505 [Bizionia myxarmorum]
MDIQIIRLVFDSGLLVLIWLVQLVVYPSFLYYEKQNLLIWHKKYTAGISMIVMPLMFGQLIIASMQCIQLATAQNIINLILVMAVWIITFLQFVPIHNKITQNLASESLLKRLVKRNWWRTILWTLIFCWSIFSHLH